MQAKATAGAARWFGWSRSRCIGRRRSSALFAAWFLLCSGSAIMGQAGPASALPAAPHFEEPLIPASNDYQLGPDSLSQAGVAQGSTFTFEMKDSKIFPGSVRKIKVYIPAAYRPDRPACVYVGLDDLSFNVATVFDNLIAQGAMPPTIGIGVSPGILSAAMTPENPRFDRSMEFDSRSDRLARFLLEEVIPAVQAHTTPDGKTIRLSSNADDRAIGGASTGAIGAFTAAWERPDAFHRVFSAIGTYVGMRGGEQYYVLVRKTEPKPIRIFMQDGVNDEWPGGPEMGDWWMSNQTMNRALVFAGYDVRHVWGVGTHNPTQAAAVFPDAMRWLWRDWPKPIVSGTSHNPVLQRVLEEGKGWEIAAEGCSPGIRIAADAQGRVFYWSGGAQRVSEVAATGAVSSCVAVGEPRAFAFGRDGRMYSARPEGGVDVSAPGKTDAGASVLGGELRVQGLTVRASGEVDVVSSVEGGGTEIWRLSTTAPPGRLADTRGRASGLAFSPDENWLLVTEADSRSGLSLRVLPDGRLDAEEPFYDFAIPAWADDSGATDVSMDRDGRAYVATRMGVQVFDRNGRVVAILPLPQGGPLTGLCFGGADFDTLYVAGGGRIYRRKLKARGSPAWAQPIQLPTASAG